MTLVLVVAATGLLALFCVGLGFFWLGEGGAVGYWFAAGAFGAAGNVITAGVEIVREAVFGE